MQRVKTRGSGSAARPVRALRYLWPVFWLNRYFDRYTGGSNRPAFFDITTTFPILNSITEHHAVIKEELDAALATRCAIPRYHELDFLQYSISAKVDRDRDWKVLMLYAMGERPVLGRRLCPKTCALLDTIPNVFQAFFSILDPGKSIPRHAAPYRGYLRYHLGMKVPQENPPVLRLGNRDHVWQEGKAILFDDTLYHEVINRADEQRVILVIDVLRPMPKMAHLVNRVIVYGAAKYVYAKGILKVSPLISRISRHFEPRTSEPLVPEQNSLERAGAEQSEAEGI